jgi:hypothetical protein
MKFFALIDTMVISALLFIIAVIASKNDGLLMLGLKVQSWTGGALLGLFMSKIVFNKWMRYKLTPSSVIGAYAIGMGGVYVNTQILQWDWNLNVYWGCILSLIFLKIYSLIKPMPKVVI